jgi:hypothetical protein
MDHVSHQHGLLQSSQAMMALITHQAKSRTILKRVFGEACEMSQ